MDLTDGNLQQFIGSHNILLSLLSAIGGLFGGGGIIGGILKIVAILSPGTDNNKVKTLLEGLFKKKDTLVKTKTKIYVRNIDGSYTTPNGTIVQELLEE